MCCSTMWATREVLQHFACWESWVWSHAQHVDFSVRLLKRGKWCTSDWGHACIFVEMFWMMTRPQAAAWFTSNIFPPHIWTAVSLKLAVKTCWWLMMMLLVQLDLWSDPRSVQVDVRKQFFCVNVVLFLNEFSLQRSRRTHDLCIWIAIVQNIDQLWMMSEILVNYIENFEWVGL